MSNEQLERDKWNAQVEFNKSSLELHKQHDRRIKAIRMQTLGLFLGWVIGTMIGRLWF